MTPEEPRNTDGSGEEPFRAHMRRAGALVAERRLPEAEQELVRALVASPTDLRALKLLALVRFRLGRFSEARESYRRVAQAAPEDAAARLNLGLIALKLEWFVEAAEELEAATKLRPDDQRALGYLGYAYARLGRTTEAAEAFRRAGQHELVAELEGRDPGALTAAVRTIEPEGEREFARVRTEITQVEVSGGSRDHGRADPAVTPVRAGTSLSLTSFTIGRLLSPDEAANSEWVSAGIYRYPVRDEAHVSLDAMLAADGGLVVEPARRRARGRVGSEALGDRGPFYKCVGAGEVWLTSPRRGGSLMALALEEDVLYLREERVLAFGGELVWECGRVPRSPLALLQFRGSGRVLVDWGGVEVVAVRLTEPRRMIVPDSRLFGWIGRVVVQGVASLEGTPSPQVACEGEGVLLIARNGKAGEPVHQRPEPGHDGARPADPDRPPVHR